MGDEQDSWFKPFGFDPGKLAQEVFDKGKAVVEAGVKEVKDDFNKAKEFAEDKIDKGEKAIKSAVSPSAPSPKPASSAGGASSPSSLGGSVGRGGKNNPEDVKGIQRALGISDDGKCGPGTIKAIEDFQKSIGQAKPDGRIDPGGATSRALAGGAKGGPAAASGSPPAQQDENSGSLFDRAVQGVKDLGGKVVKEAEEDFDAAKAFGGEVIQGAKKALGDPNIALNQARPPDAGPRDAGTPDAGPRDAGASDADAPDAGAEETPSFNPTSPVPHDVRADTLEEFVNGANAGRGPVGSAGHMKPTINFLPTEDSKGRITRVNMVVETSIVRPRFAGGRPTPQQRELIIQAQELIRGHEERHRDIARDFTTRAVRAMRGKPRKEADKEFKKLMKAMDDAQRDMDLREGALIVDFNGPNGRAGPSTGVRLGPAPP